MFEYPKNVSAPHHFQFYARRDFRSALNLIDLPMHRRPKELLLAQSCEGHAQMGHCGFSEKDDGKVIRYPFPNATIESIVRAIREDPENFRQERQELIDKVLEMPDRILENPDIKRYMDDEGFPFFGIDYFEHIRLNDPGAFLVGAYLASRVDNYDPWRRDVEERYGIVMGGGENVAVHMPSLQLLGFDLNDLSNLEWNERKRKRFEDLGIIFRDVPATGEMISGYIRHKLGSGISDDVMVVLAGMVYGPDAFVGAFLTDAIDTWDKYTPQIRGNGQDEMFGDMIKGRENDLKKVLPDFSLPSDDEVLKFIYNVSMAKNRGAIDYKNGKHEKRMVADSSQRYFLQISPETGMSAFESHFKYIMGHRPPKFHIGWKGSNCTNYDIYRCVEERLEESYLRL